MASKVSSDDEEDFLTCGICFEYYDSDIHVPKLLCCFHSCCIVCLKGTIKGISSTITCPFCRHDTKLIDGVKGLTTNFYIMPRVEKAIAQRKREIEVACAAGSYNSTQTTDTSSSSPYVQSKHLMCYLQFMVNGNLIQQRVVFRLDFDQSPKMSSQFMNHCLGINGKTYEGSRIFKTEDSHHFVCGKMDAEPYLADRSTLPKTKGALRMRHRMKRRKCNGDVYVSSEFSVICKDEKDNQELLTTVFGYVHKGLGVCEYICRLNSGENEIIIHSCGTWVDLADEEMEQTQQTCQTNLPTTRFIAPTEDDKLAKVSGSNIAQNQGLCYVQFSIDGDVQSKIFFRLDFDAAPSMCEVFLECFQITINSSLSYKTSPVAETESGKSFTAGRISSYPYSYIANFSFLAEKKGALCMRQVGRLGEWRVKHTTEFTIICCEPDPYKNIQLGTVIGYVHWGIEICEYISLLNPLEKNITIHSCGTY